MMTNNTIHLIYAGGTFGGHGTPLSPLPADVFLPFLQKQLNEHGFGVQILPNPIIKDSSTLTPSDFCELYALILQAYDKGARRFVLITGTDSLSFVASFLANALADFSDISLVITGSMQPLLVATEKDLRIDTHSDAWQNLSDALATSAFAGVFVQFFGKSMSGFNTQKIDSSQFDAFTGEPIDLSSCLRVSDAPATQNETQKQAQLANLSTLKANAKHTQIQAVYCLPNDVANLEHQLNTLNDAVKAVILIGFGAGNLPSSPKLIERLEALNKNGVAIICTTMCAFGGTNANYAAGAWQYHCGVWAAADLSIAAIYGQALWLALNERLTLANWKIKCSNTAS